MLRSLRAWCTRRLGALLTAVAAVCTWLLGSQSPALAMLPCLLLGGALALLHRRSGQAAQAELEQTRHTLRQSEARHLSLQQSTEARMAELHRSLVEVSRQAGMAEIATGVLHNVGNTLNSINVSAGVVGERLRSSRVQGLAKAVELLKANADRLPAFLTQGARGQQLPAYLVAVAEHLVREREALLQEVQVMAENIEHVKAIVSVQQEHARPTGLVERLPVAQLVDDALRLHAISFERLGIQVHREYEPMGLVEVDRHRLLQVLLNLLSNARHALLESGRPDRHVTIRVQQGEGQRLRIEVADNGVGIAPESLARLFTQGFTTKRGGHGFGLHISALAAQELGGQLTARSEGLGQGATFTLELPPRGAQATP